jgi:hypothetical protein
VSVVPKNGYMGTVCTLQVSLACTASCLMQQGQKAVLVHPSQVGRFQLRLHRDMVVANLLQLLRERAGHSWEGKPLRLLRMRDSEIYKV